MVLATSHGKERGNRTTCKNGAWNDSVHSKKQLITLQPCGDAVLSKNFYKIEKSGSLNQDCFFNILHLVLNHSEPDIGRNCNYDPWFCIFQPRKAAALIGRFDVLIRCRI